MRVTEEGNEFEGTTDHVEKWYGTPYCVYKIPESTLKKKWECAGINEHFHSLRHRAEIHAANYSFQATMLSVCEESISRESLKNIFGDKYKEGLFVIQRQL